MALPAVVRSSFRSLLRTIHAVRVCDIGRFQASPRAGYLEPMTGAPLRGPIFHGLSPAVERSRAHAQVFAADAQAVVTMSAEARTAFRRNAGERDPGVIGEAPVPSGGRGADTRSSRSR